MEIVSRALTWIMSLAIGLMFGAAGTISYASTLGGFPAGLIIALIGSAAILIALRLISKDRIAVIAAGAGELVAFLLFSGKGPGASVIVPDSPLAMVWAIGLTAVVVLVALWPDASKLRSATAK